MVAKSAEGNPLSPFSRLSPSIYLREPTTTPNDDGTPATIVIAFWMNAPPRALVKYVIEYGRLAPSARIIFILSSASDFLFRATASAQRRRLAPAVEAIRASADPKRPVFFHIFSNGGTFTTLHLLMAYRAATGKPMPIFSMIIDSAPGKATIASGAKALSFALPRQRILRFFGMGIIYTVLVIGWLVRKITRAKDSVTLARTGINDSRIINAVDGQAHAKKRCYIYSDTDELISWQDVEEHAADAEAKGWVVEKEKFGSPHVGHMREDPERYWGIVKRYLEDASVS